MAAGLRRITIGSTITGGRPALPTLVLSRYMAAELLDIVDETGAAIGVADRERIHREGLLHRTVHVWLLTPKGELVFQRRSKSKRTWPGMLDATTAGHVNLHEDFETAAMRELIEETGVVARLVELHPIARMHDNATDSITGAIHNVLRQVYVVHYDGPLAKLKADVSETFGFEAWPIQTVLQLSEEQKSRFIPFVVSDAYLTIYRDIEKLIHG